jgi:hypothetical protein
MGDVHYVVDRLRGAPYNLNVSLLSIRHAANDTCDLVVALPYSCPASTKTTRHPLAVRRHLQSCCGSWVMSLLALPRYSSRSDVFIICAPITCIIVCRKVPRELLFLLHAHASMHGSATSASTATHHPPNAAPRGQR